MQIRYDVISLLQWHRQPPTKKEMPQFDTSWWVGYGTQKKRGCIGEQSSVPSDRLTIACSRKWREMQSVDRFGHAFIPMQISGNAQAVATRLKKMASYAYAHDQRTEVLS